MIDTDKYIEDVEEKYNLIMNLMDDEEREFEIKTRIRLSNKMKAAIDKLDTEVKRAYQLIVDAAWQLHWNVGTIASSAHLSSKEWDEEIYAPAQAWRKQVQEILDASEEGCPWKESEEE